MRRFYIITLAIIIVVVMKVGATITQNDDNNKEAKHTAAQDARQQRRAERLAEYERYIDSLVMSHNFRFAPQTMQQLPAGMMRNLGNPAYEVVVQSSDVDVCMPFLKGYTPPYYPVVFNYVLPYVSGYTAEQTSDGWNVTFSSTLFSTTDYTFHFEIYSRYGGAMLTISSPFYNSVQYTGNIMGI
jgi:hypothetical protein